MTLLELVFVVVAAILGARFGLWLANKQAEARAEVQSLNTRIDIENDVMSCRLDSETHELWRRISELDTRVTEFLEKEKK